MGFLYLNWGQEVWSMQGPGNTIVATSSFRVCHKSRKVLTIPLLVTFIFTLADCGFIQLSTKETPQRIIKFTTAYTQLSSLYQFLAPYLIISGSRVYLSFTIHWK